MPPSSDTISPVELLADEFLIRLKRGDKPTIQEYCDRHPDQASEIRDVFEALLMVEDLKPASSDESGSFGTSVKADGKRLEQVGDYRILREIGRGGMGVVYEAEQEALGRRVALKVLPRDLTGDGSAIIRFQREAKAAARMHHTNIVPVFDVGQDGEIVFYVMQLIQGQGLDHVIGDLKRLKEKSVMSANKEEATKDKSIAVSLILGQFKQENLASSPMNDSDLTKTYEGSAPVSAVLPGQSELSSVHSNRSAYFRSVAQIGMQTASALTYAHARGIIHRDIKPGNLLLDSAGNVWVTDFGLAKTGDTGMTHTGDILGTIRYMSPERFRGQCDMRADVYALGMTLYEMLTLKPAFASGDRLKLIEQIRQADPPTPRSVDARIPRDLETIIVKAIDKDPKRRYQSADEMAEDLHRFVADEPIKARRTGSIERAWRWCRRNPAVAISNVAAILFLTLVGVTASIGYVNTKSALALAQAERDKAIEQERLTEEARQEAIRNLVKFREAVDQLLNRAEDERLANVPLLQPLRNDLLKDAVKFYRSIMQQNATDPTLRFETSLAFFRLAEIHRNLNQIAEAEAAIQESMKIQDELLLKFPDDGRFKFQLALSTRKYADILGLDVRRNLETNHGYRRAILLFEAAEKLGHDKAACLSQQADALYWLARIDSNNSLDDILLHQSRLINKLEQLDPGSSYLVVPKHSHLQLKAEHLLAGSRRKEALDVYLQAVGIIENLSRSDNSAGVQLSLGWSYINLARYQRELGQTTAALNSYERSIRVLEALVSKHRTNYFHLSALAEAYWQLGYSRHISGQVESGIELCLKAEKIIDELVEMTHANARQHGDMCHHIANVYKNQNDQKESTRWYEKSAKILSALATKLADEPGFRINPDELKRLDLRSSSLASVESVGFGEGTSTAKTSQLPPLARARCGPDIVNTMLGDVYASWGKSEDAIKCYRQAISISLKLAREHLLLHELCVSYQDAAAKLTSLLRKEGRLDEAIDVQRVKIAFYDQITAEAPNEFLILVRKIQAGFARFEYADVLVEARKTDDAVTTIQKAMELISQAPRDLKGFREHGITHEYLCNRCLALWNLMHKIRPADLNHNWRLKAREYARAGREEILTAPEQQSKAEPNNYQSWHNLGAAHYRLGEWTECIAAMEKAIERLPQSSAYQWLYLAIAHGELGHVDIAQKYYRASVQWMAESDLGGNPGLLNALLAEARVILKLIKDDQAEVVAVSPGQCHIDAANLLVEAHPDAAWTYLRRAQGHILCRNMEKAKADIAKAIEMSEKVPESPEKKLSLARTRLLLHITDEAWAKALPPAQELLELNANDPNQWYQTAMIQLAAGDRVAYRKTRDAMLARALEKPTKYDVRWAVVIANLFPEPTPKTLELLEKHSKIFALDEDNLIKATNRGIALFRAEKYPQAKTILLQADEFASRPGSVTSVSYYRYFLAMTEFKLGNTLAARSWLDKARVELEKPGVIHVWNRKLTLQWFDDEAAKLILHADQWAAIAAMRKSHWADAIKHLDPLIKSQPNFWPDRALRGRCYGALGQYEQAYKDFQAVADAGASDLATIEFPLAILSLQTDRKTNYQKLCSRILDSVNSKDTFEKRHWAAIICKLGPLPESDVLRALALLRQPQERTSVYGHLLVRLSRFEEARKLLELKMKEESHFGDYFSRPFLSMALYALKHTNDARKLIDENRIDIEKNLQHRLSGVPWLETSLQWAVRLDVERLRKDAEAQILGKSVQ